MTSTLAAEPEAPAAEPEVPYVPGQDSALRRGHRQRSENATLRARVAQLEAELAEARAAADTAPHGVSIDDLREALMEAALGKGAACMVCGRLAKVYRRSISDAQARSLDDIYAKNGHDWASLPDDGDTRSREEHKLRYWGLLEESTERREDGGRGGMWRVTALGARWVRGEVTMPKYAYTYQNRVLRLDGEQRSFTDALKQGFDLRSVLVDVPAAPSAANAVAAPLPDPVAPVLDEPPASEDLAALDFA